MSSFSFRECTPEDFTIFIHTGHRFSGSERLIFKPISKEPSSKTPLRRFSVELSTGVYQRTPPLSTAYDQHSVFGLQKSLYTRITATGSVCQSSFLCPSYVDAADPASEVGQAVRSVRFSCFIISAERRHRELNVSYQTSEDEEREFSFRHIRTKTTKRSSSKLLQTKTGMNRARTRAGHRTNNNPAVKATGPRFGSLSGPMFG